MIEFVIPSRSRKLLTKVPALKLFPSTMHRDTGTTFLDFT